MHLKADKASWTNSDGTTVEVHFSEPPRRVPRTTTGPATREALASARLDTETHCVDEPAQCGTWITKRNTRTRCVLQDGHRGKCMDGTGMRPAAQTASPPPPAQGELLPHPYSLIGKTLRILGRRDSISDAWEVEVVEPQPPAAPGTPLTVEVMVEALRKTRDYDGLRFAALERLADELERAQKGTP